MKKLVFAFLILCLLLGFSSCKIGDDSERRKIPEEAKEIASQIEELNTKKDSSVLENLTDEQKKFFDSIGHSSQGNKLVVYNDTINYTLSYECEFENGVVSKVTSYHIIKNQSYFNALKAGINKKSEATVDEKNKVIMADKTNEYKAKTYDEMLKELSEYTVVQ